MENDEVKPSAKARAAREKRDARKKPKVIGYCMKCSTKRPLNDPHDVIIKNGRKAVEGTCRQCGNKIIRLGSMPGATEEPIPVEPRKKIPPPPTPSAVRREAVAAPIKVEEDGWEVIEELPVPARAMTGSDPYDDPVLYNALQEKVRAGIAKGARSWGKKEGRFYIRVPGGATHSLGDKELNLPSPPTTSAKARQAIEEVFAEHNASLAAEAAMVPLPPSPSDVEQLAGEPAKSMQQQPFVRELVAQAVWMNRAYNTIGKVAVQVLMNTKLVSGQEMLAALKESSPTTYIALVSSGLEVMEQNIKDPDAVVRLKSEIHEHLRNIEKMKVLMKKVLANAFSVKAELLRRNESLQGDLDLAVALMRPQDKLEYYRQRALFAVAMSRRNGDGHGQHKETEPPTADEVEE